MTELTEQYIKCMDNQQQEQRKAELDINNFNYEREYIRRFKFIMLNSCYLPIELIKHANSIINRKETVDKLEQLIKCYPIAVEIEKGIFEFTLNYIKTQILEYSDIIPIYTDKFNEIYDNLDISNKKINNQTLLPAVIKGIVPGQTIPFLKMFQLHPARWKALIDKNNLRDVTLYTVNTTDEYQCGRCKMRKHTYYITQTRSSDEPATIFYTCVNCKKTFTKSI